VFYSFHICNVLNILRGKTAMRCIFHLQIYGFKSRAIFSRSKRLLLFVVLALCLSLLTSDLSIQAISARLSDYYCKASSGHRILKTIAYIEAMSLKTDTTCQHHALKHA